MGDLLEVRIAIVETPEALMHRNVLPFVATLLVAVPALAGTPDQSNAGPLSGGTSVGVIGSSFSQAVAQTVIVGFDGRLDRVDMYINASGGISQPLILEIHRVSGGVPVEPGLTARSMLPSPIGLQWLTFDFSGESVDVVQGRQVALVLRSEQDLTRGEYDAEGSQDVYHAGASFVSNNAGPWTAIANYDLMFLTFVNPGAACCSADYNGDDIWGGDGDIEDFFRCLGGDCCPTCPLSGDFNCDGDAGTDADIEAFFSVLAGGAC